MEHTENTERKTGASSRKRKDNPATEGEQKAVKRARTTKEKTKEEKKTAIVAPEEENEHGYDDDAPITFINTEELLLAGAALFKKKLFVSAEVRMEKMKYFPSGVVIQLRRETDNQNNYDTIRVPFKTRKRADEYMCSLVRMMASLNPGGILTI